MNSALTFLIAFAAIAPGIASATDVDGARRPVPLFQFSETVAEIQALPEAELKRFYLRCSQAAMRGRITTGDIQLCSVGYERLLQRSFGGDIRRLLEWRRNVAARSDSEREIPNP